MEQLDSIAQQNEAILSSMLGEEQKDEAIQEIYNHLDSNSNSFDFSELIKLSSFRAENATLNDDIINKILSLLVNNDTGIKLFDAIPGFSTALTTIINRMYDDFINEGRMNEYRETFCSLSDKYSVKFSREDVMNSRKL